MELTILSPIAHELRYFMRNASGVKKKDRESGKLSLLEKVAFEVGHRGALYGYDYTALFEPWFTFIYAMEGSPYGRIQMKALGTRWYWNTVGTAVAHGRGFFKHAANFSDRFGG